MAFCTTDDVVQKTENIKLLFEIKMSVVSNYKYSPSSNKVEYVSDYKQHKGNPSLLRSDSMLKAIGKSINIRVSGISSSKIPIIILGNSPITESYIKRVDFLKSAGVIQGFWSLNPKPTNSEYVNITPKSGFQTILNEKQLLSNCTKLVRNDMNYFSSMISKLKLGDIISIANKETTNIAKAEKFLTLIRS